MPWGEQINLQWRDEKGKMVFNYPALAKGQMERRLSKVESKPILKLYRIEAGWLGQTSKEIAASVYRRNLWVLHGMLILFALLMLYAYRTQQKAARLEQLKTDFISQMSHELKTPLATIKLAAETLQKGRFQTLDEASQSGDLIHQQSQILAKRINRLFEFSRSAEGQHIPDHSDLPIEKIWQRLQQQASNMALSWQRKLEIQGEAFGEASLSEEAIWSIVEILLENAFQYSPTDQVVSFSSQVHSRFWQLSVSDQGPGIAKEQQELIFEKFVRLDSSDTQSHGGYGMGLTIARQLATKMNGQILLQSTVGKGSRFTLKISLSA
ncbi:MAG: HAMP domain-containing sensor histidine kinase [Bacteroidota bacterium]